MILYVDDLSFDDPQSLRNRPFINRLFILALLVSCLFHLLILFIFPDWHLWKPVASTSRPSLQIEIQLATIKKSEDILLNKTLLLEKPADQADSISSPTSNLKTTEVVATSENTIDATSKKIELLGSEEIKELSRDKQLSFSADDSLAFNPRLKENQAIKRSMPKGGAYKQELEFWKDVHGNQFYQVDGKCYKAPVQAKGISSTNNATNWYAISCGGKSESEKATDRINYEMKQRFRH